MSHPRLIVIALAVLSLPIGTEAHVGDRIYPIPELTDGMLASIDVKDGSVDDWADILGDPALTPLDFSLEINPDGPEFDPADLSFQIWLGWHRGSNRIAVGIICVDDQYEGGYTGVGDTFNSYDSVILLVDGDHSGPPYGQTSASRDAFTPDFTG